MKSKNILDNGTHKQRVGRAIAGTAISLVFFIIIGIVLIVVGFILTLTIIGAIIGIPMMLAGVASIICSPFGGLALLKQKKSECPYCKSPIILNGKQAFDCSVCKKRLFIKDNKVFLVK